MSAAPTTAQPTAIPIVVPVDRPPPSSVVGVSVALSPVVVVVVLLSFVLVAVASVVLLGDDFPAAASSQSFSDTPIVIPESLQASRIVLYVSVKSFASSLPRHLAVLMMKSYSLEQKQAFCA